MFHLGVNDLRVNWRSDERTPLLPVAIGPAPVISFLPPTSRARAAERHALHDQAGVLALAGSGAIYARQFFCNWVISPQWAIAGLSLKSTVALANATVGRYATLPKHAQADASTVVIRSRVPWRCAVPAALAAARLVACPIGEVPAMAASFALHFAADMLPEKAGRVVAWSAFGAYLVVREMMFAYVALPRHIVNFDAPEPTSDEPTCNGQAVICQKRWCDTVFPATHNAGALSVPFSSIPAPLNQLGRFASNQDRSLETQFHDGIRGFLLEYYRDRDGTLMGSHNVYWNFEPMVRTFGRLRTLVESRPRELIVLKMSPQGRMGDMWDLVQKALDDSGLSLHMRTERPSCNTTVGALLDAGRQVIAFDRDFRETYYSARNVGEIGCRDLLPWNGTTNDMPVTLNAFSTYAFQPASDVVNSHLTQIFDGCRALLNDMAFTPTLLAVNHYETSAVVPLAHAINGNLTLPRSTPSQRAMMLGFAEDGAAASALVCLLGMAMLSLLSRFTWWRSHRMKS